MSYIVRYDDEYLFEPYTMTAIYDAKLSEDMNAPAYFDFSIPRNHPLYEKIEDRKGTVKIFFDDTLLFMGEIDSISEDFEGNKSVSCVDLRDRLNDILLRPYSTFEENKGEVAPSNVNSYFQWLIDKYNEGAGIRNVTFSVGVNQGALLDKDNQINRSSSDYPTVGEEIENKILNSLGGYLVITYLNDSPVLNLYADLYEANSQVIDFGVNLLDFVKTENTENQYTAVLALGGTPEQTDDNQKPEQVTLSLLPDGPTDVDSDYIKQGDVVYSLSAVNQYGYKEYTFTDSETLDVDDLLEKAIADLKKVRSPKVTIEIKAVDLALISGKNDFLKCGQVVRVRSKPHGLDEYLMVSSVDINLQDPSQTSYTLGRPLNSLTGEQSAYVKSLNAGINSSLDAVAGIDQSVKDQAVKVDQAVSDAENALNTANGAKDTADNAQQAAEDAAKTATNYLNFDSNGLVVGDQTAEKLGGNVLIDSDSVDIRNGSEILSSFAGNSVEFKSTDFKIKSELSHDEAYDKDIKIVSLYQLTGTEFTENGLTNKIVFRGGGSYQLQLSTSFEDRYADIGMDSTSGRMDLSWSNRLGGNVNQLLWEGSWSSGSINVSNTLRYSLFDIVFSNPDDNRWSAIVHRVSSPRYDSSSYISGLYPLFYSVVDSGLFAFANAHIDLKDRYGIGVSGGSTVGKMTIKQGTGVYLGGTPFSTNKGTQSMRIVKIYGII